jgi:hypothetical protein
MLTAGFRAFQSRHASTEDTMLPNLIVIGAAKSGTTSLYQYLSRHPEIWMSQQMELDFFTKNSRRGLPWYESFFPRPAALGAEASPNYTWFPLTATSRIGWPAWSVRPSCSTWYEIRSSASCPTTRSTSPSGAGNCRSTKQSPGSSRRLWDQGAVLDATGAVPGAVSGRTDPRRRPACPSQPAPGNVAAGFPILGVDERFTSPRFDGASSLLSSPPARCIARVQ